MAYRGDGIPGARTDVLYFEVQKCGERYIVLYADTEESTNHALQQVARWAANPELNFNWYDAAVSAQRIRKQRKETGQRER